jgi:hypothetical protein
MPTGAEKQVDEQLAIALEFAEVKLTLAEMICHVDLEAHMIEGSERARLLAGLALAPNDDQIGRIARNLAVVRFLQSCHDRPAEAARHFEKIARNRATE